MSPVEIARSQIGKPWAHQARGPDWWDCIGLLILSFAAYGIKDRTDYDRNPRDGQLERCVREEFGSPVPMASMRENDAVCLAFPRVVRHVAIIANHHTGGLSLIHTWARGPRCVTETRIDERWHRRIKFVHRMPEP